MEVNILEELVNRNLICATRNIFSKLNKTDVSHLFLALRKKSKLFQKPVKYFFPYVNHNVTLARIAQSSRSSFAIKNEKHNKIILTEREAEKLRWLQANADYFELLKNTIDHEKSHQHEAFILPFPDYAAATKIANYLFVNDDFIAVTLVDKSYLKTLRYPDLSRLLILLYDRRNFCLINSMSLRGTDSVRLYLPLKGNARSAIVIYYSTHTQDIAIIWDALGTGKVQNYDLTTPYESAHLNYGNDCRPLRFIRTANLFIYFYFITGKEMATVYTVDEGNQPGVKLLICNELLSASVGVSGTDPIAFGNRYLCILSSKIENNHLLLLRCQLRSKSDFTLLKTVTVELSTHQHLNLDLLESYGTDGGWNVIYVLEDSYIFLENKRDSCIDVRSLANMVLVYVFYAKLPQPQNGRMTSPFCVAKVTNGYLTVEDSLSANYAAWKLPCDLLEQCNMCLKTGAIGFSKPLYFREIEKATATGFDFCRQTVIDDYGVCDFSSLDPRGISITIKKPFLS